MKAKGTAVVTGAGRGLGRWIALELARRGFDVHATMRRPETARDLEEDARALGGGALRVAALDVTRPETIDLPADVRVLVNNAGVEGPWLPLEEEPLDDWRAIFETNVFGLVEVTRRALPRLRQAGASGGACICNVTSCSLFAPMPFFAAYRASKAAVSALGESLRVELAPFGVRVIEIVPGAIATDMLAGVQDPPEATGSPVYGAAAEVVHAHRAPSVAAGTPPGDAARAIADAILADESPLRVACDPMGAGLLEAWRATDDETLQGPMRALFGAPGD
jgi:NAD(P)-dependent dehydrogenase (short-subunit alcohol dehydrogenase family)